MQLRFIASLIALSTLSAGFAEKPQIKTTLLWSSGENGYDTYRIPGIVVTANGVVLAYGVGRQKVKDGDWADMDIYLRRSTDGGNHWDKSQHMAGNTHGVTDNPVAIADRTPGVVHFLYQHDYATVFYRKSIDDGKTFSDPIDITSALTGLRSQFNWNVVALGPGHAIQLKSGRLLVPVWLADGKQEANGRRAHGPAGITTMYSDDEGKTWAHGDIIALNSPEMTNPNELQVIQLSDGRVMANIRTGDKALRRAVAYSPDGIGGWTRPVFDPHLYDPICDAGIVRYDSKRILFTNPDSSALPKKPTGQGLRQNLTVRMSEDDGKTWPVAKLLVPGGTGYSDIAVDQKTKAIFDIYEAHDDADPDAKSLSLYVARFNLAWLEKR